ncbi:oligosaccharide flippase family protein [Methylovirgula sp. 4M-Z18]|uniref:oligosaccharide flippase family protein n=1 Tax=Methylovirgula sp. 4M-Z18 TaxID=2293567 RepID=UPI000E2EC5EF|nr:oligosaccharide flippase family protein [Methylovirgula sp. 4M-Z18]RFB81087.1 polysaccharide biosynthesis protein [Methylovirgula sp. 4M-Z18]
MKPVPRSILFSAIERYVSLVLFFVGTAVLARLLTPAEFGVYAVINALTSIIAASAQELGGANYLIQKQDLSRANIHTTFTITVAISAFISVLLLAAAQPLSRFFGQEGLAFGVVVSALSFLLLPVSNTISALFRRNMEFRELAVCNLVANASGIVVSCVLAACHFSYMAPVWGAVTNTAALAIMLLSRYASFDIFRISLVDSREIISFGLYSSAISIINMFYNLSPQLFLARVLDFASVGLYSRAVNLTQVFDKLITQVVNPVLMPAVVAQRKVGADLKAVYLETMQLLAAVQWPFLLFIAVMAQPIIFLWLGSGWLEIVPIVRLLCIANTALFAACLSYPMFVATGNVRSALVTSLISLPPSLLVILLASFFGVQMVAASALVTLPFQAAVAIYYLARLLNIKVSQLVHSLTKSVVVTILTSVGPVVCATLVDNGTMTALLGLISASVSAALCWVLGLMLAAHPLLRRLGEAAESLAFVVPGVTAERWAAWFHYVQKDRW